MQRELEGVAVLSPLPWNISVKEEQRVHLLAKPRIKDKKCRVDPEVGTQVQLCTFVRVLRGSCSCTWTLPLFWLS